MIEQRNEVDMTAVEINVPRESANNDSNNEHNDPQSGNFNYLIIKFWFNLGRQFRSNYDGIFDIRNKVSTQNCKPKNNFFRFYFYSTVLHEKSIPGVGFASKDNLPFFG